MPGELDWLRCFVACLLAKGHSPKILQRARGLHACDRGKHSRVLRRLNRNLATFATVACWGFGLPANLAVCRKALGSSCRAKASLTARASQTHVSMISWIDRFACSMPSVVSHLFSDNAFGHFACRLRLESREVAYRSVPQE